MWIIFFFDQSYRKPSNYAPGILTKTLETPFPDLFKAKLNGI